MNRDKKISVFGGTGFIGSRFIELFEEKCNLIERNSRDTQQNNILYFISTTDNYNVFSNLKVDIETNLSVLMDVFEKLKMMILCLTLYHHGLFMETRNFPQKKVINVNLKGFIL